MNETRHTHDPRITRATVTKKGRLTGIGKTIYDAGEWRLTYGDTVVRICRPSKTPTPEMVERATLRAIELHDLGSIAAGKAEEERKAREQAKREAQNALLQTARDTVAQHGGAAWGPEPEPVVDEVDELIETTISNIREIRLHHDTCPNNGRANGQEVVACGCGLGGYGINFGKVEIRRFGDIYCVQCGKYGPSHVHYGVPDKTWITTAS